MDLFTLTLIKKTSVHRFGDPDETISSVLGRNKKSETLSGIGRFVVKVLDWIDPNHSTDSIGRFKQ